ncbi:MAG: dienelactone hydrolase family protein [Acidimicrobiales bacterium]
MITFASNGGTDQGYLATPASGDGPGVVVIQEWWGLVPHIADVCDRFAAEGFVALAPDLYRGLTAAEPDEAQKAMMGMRLDQAGKDMSGAVDEVARRSAGPKDGVARPSAGPKVGVVGYCMGGGLALVLGCQRPDRVAAVVPYYGLIPWPNAAPDYSAMTAAVQGHYAAEDDFAGPEKARELERALTGLGKQAEVFIYPDTHHGFFNDARPAQHSAEASALAWGRTVAFLRSTLE